MSSDNPFGPSEVKGPGLIRRPRGLLLDVAEPIDTSDLRPQDPGQRTYSVAERMAGGVVFCANSCSLLSTFENQWCVTDPTDPELPDSYSDGDGAEFDSFAIVNQEINPARFYEPFIEARIQARIEAMRSAQLAQEMLTGANTGNPSLAGNVTHLVSALTPLDEVLYVINEIAAGLAGLAFTIMSSPGTFELLNSEFDVSQDDEDEDDPNNAPFRSATGHVLVGDAGIDGSAEPDETADNGSWVYAFPGLPQVWLGDVDDLGDETANFSRTRNTRTDVKAQNAIVAFDPCMVIAVQAQVPAYVVTDGGSGS